MTQKTLFDEEVEKEEEDRAAWGMIKAIYEKEEKEVEKEVDEEQDIKIGIRIAEAEMDHNIRDAFNNMKNKRKKKQAKKLLQEITAISLTGDEDKGLDTFAKVLHLEKVLGLSYEVKK